MLIADDFFKSKRSDRIERRLSFDTIHSTIVREFNTNKNIISPCNSFLNDWFPLATLLKQWR